LINDDLEELLAEIKEKHAYNDKDDLFIRESIKVAMMLNLSQNKSTTYKFYLGMKVN